MNTILKVVGLAPDDEGNGEREDIQEANKDFLESRDLVNLAEEDQDQNAERAIGDFIGTEVENLTEDDEHVREEVDKHLKHEVFDEEIFEKVENADDGITIHNIYESVTHSLSE